MSRDTNSMTPFDSFGELPDPTAPPQYEHHSPHRRRGLFHAVHRALRGRYWLVIPLAILAAGGGAFGGWKLFKPQYRSNGSVMIQYQIDSPFSKEHSQSLDGMPMYEEFLTTQTYIMMNRPTILLAMNDPAWIATGRGNDTKTIQKFVENLVVEHPRSSQAIRINYTDYDPAVAQAAVVSLIDAYEKMYAARDKLIQEKKLEILQRHITEYRLQIEGEKRSIEEIAREYGTEDFAKIYENHQMVVNKLHQQLGDAKLSLALTSNRGDLSKIVGQMTLDEIGMIDPGMARKLDNLAHADADLSRLLISFGDKNIRVIEANRLRDQAYTDAQEYAERYRNMKKNGLGNSANQTKEALDTEVKSLTKMYADATEEMKTVGNKLLDIGRHREKVKQLTEDMRDTEHDKQLILDENKTDGRLKILNPGDAPIMPYRDRRIATSIIGGFAGIAAIVGLFMIMPHMHRRYRFSDEAERAAGLPPLLGILPMLPDRLSDPEQAAIAAHCIHQLRIMLQVNGGSDRKVLLITSASAGDGKTSLTMALGLSFAASGSRTLVIDGDMIGQGLTARLKSRQSPGLLEALGAGTLSGRVKKTTTPNLYILPIGNASSSHAGSLSPVSIRKVLTEARRIFDTVIIDTGPILGSLEATVIAAAADSVILTIARGQQRPLVDRSVRQLRQLGSNLIGLVFNRAEQRDFQRSVGSSSIRSVGVPSEQQRVFLAEGAEESRFGPLARSVASFLPTSPAKPAAPALPPEGEIRVAVVSKEVEPENKG